MRLDITCAIRIDNFKDKRDGNVLFTRGNLQKARGRLASDGRLQAALRRLPSVKRRGPVEN